MDKNNKTILQWKNGLRIRHIGHMRSFTRFKLIDRIIGLASTVISAVVATTVFASLSESDNRMTVAIAGGISVLATLLSGAYSFLKFSELAERHRQAGASFGDLRRSLEIILIDEEVKTIDNEKLQEINNAWSELEKKAPSIPQRIYSRAEKQVVAKTTG